MRTSNSLLRNYRYIATIVLAGIKANGNINDASLKRLHSVSGHGINGVLSPGDAFDLESPLNCMFQKTFFAFVNNVPRHWRKVDFTWIECSVYSKAVRKQCSDKRLLACKCETS